MVYTRVCDGCGQRIEPGSIRYVLSEYEKSTPVYRQDFCSYPCVIAPKVTGGRSRHAPPFTLEAYPNRHGDSCTCTPCIGGWLHSAYHNPKTCDCPREVSA